MKKLILLKIGGGVITDKKVRYGLKLEVLQQIAKEIAAGYRDLKETDLIVGNGAGSFAHFSAAEYRTMEGFVEERSRVGLGWVRYDAVKLNQIVLEELLKAGVPAFSMSPSSLMSVADSKVVGINLTSLSQALAKGIVPLVHGDTMIDAVTGCTVFSTERVFDEMAKELAPQYSKIRVIHVSSEEGVRVDGSVYSEITSNNIEQVQYALLGSDGIDVTGGMMHKVKACLEIAKIGIESLIVSGMVPGRVNQAMMGNAVIGTRIWK